LEHFSGISFVICHLPTCDSISTLAAKIEADMPTSDPGSCVDDCADDTSAYIFEVLNSNTTVTDPIDATIAKGSVTIGLETVVSGLVAPLELKSAGDSTGRLFVVDQSGKIYIIDSGVVQTDLFLDVSDRIVSPLGILGSYDEDDYDERGLLGLAFHPDFADAGSTGYRKIYTYTSEPVDGTADFTTVALPDGSEYDHQSVIAEWTVDSNNSNIIDTSSRREIMRIDQPQFNHNGGMLEFGPDGYLYIALGDGGSANDNDEGHGDDGNGQNTDTVHGSLLRIDPLDPDNTPDSSDTASANGEYRIPADNPLASTDGVDEIFAYGFRNPYRFSFDADTSRLIVADVGQNNLEEINIVASGQNFGWNLKEGTFRFVSETGNVTDNVSDLPEDLVDPVAQYDHDDGTSIIGGFVYRGEAISDLSGKYVFGDFSTSFSSGAGRLFYADLDTGTINEFIIDNDDQALGMFLKGFGIDTESEVYVLASSSLGPYGSGGKVLKIVPLSDDTSDDTSGSSSSNCFIATAVYGSPFHRHVIILREFRDRFLSKHSAGKAFIEFYYRHSPSLAKRILRNSHLQSMVRISLLPLVGLSWAVLKGGPLTAAAAILLLFAGIIAVVRFKRN